MLQQIITTSELISLGLTSSFTDDEDLSHLLEKGYTIHTVSQSTIALEDNEGVYLVRTWVLNPPSEQPTERRIHNG